MEQKFETGRYKVTEEEKATKSPEELKKLEEKVERANTEKMAKLGELYRRQLEEGLEEAIKEGVISQEDIDSWLEAVRQRRETQP